MSKLINCGKMEVRESSIEGYGVFATALIQKDEILEQVPFVLFPRSTNVATVFSSFLKDIKWLNEKEMFIEGIRNNLHFKDPEKYYFKWNLPHPINGETITFTVLPLGFAPIYNSSNTDNNAGWKIKDKLFEFKAERDIQPGEEIRTFYGYFLGNDGTIFNCDAVFNLAIDTVNNENIVKSIRFGNAESFEQSRQNPAYFKCHQLISDAKDGLKIKTISYYLQTGEEKGTFAIPPDFSLTHLYGKLAEFKAGPFPFVKITFEFINKSTGATMTDIVIFKK